MLPPAPVKWVLLAASAESELRARLLQITSPDLAVVNESTASPLAVAVELFHHSLDEECVLKLIMPTKRHDHSYRLVLIEQSADHTAGWLFEELSEMELLELVRWFHDPTRPVPQEPEEHREQRTTLELRELWLGRRTRHWFGATIQQERQPVGLLSGSFNPLHHGHRQLRQLAEQKLNGPVHYELPMRNADKPPLDYLSLHTRLLQFEGEPVLISTAATFVEKSEEFPNVTFIVGADTAIRIIDPRFYEGEAGMTSAFELLAERRCRFLVAPRRINGQLLDAREVALPSEARTLFEFLTPEEFCLDVSSTELRGEVDHPFGWR